MLNTNVDLLKGKILNSLIIFAIPLFISNLFQQLYNTVDIMIVGNFLGDTSLAAIGASSAVYELLIGFALGIGNGLSMVAARSYGANDTKLLRKSVAGSITMFIISTVLIGGYLAFWHTGEFWATTHWPLISAMMGFVITAIEAISAKGTDNVTVPLGTLCMLLLIG